ncbi:DNA cytosine methyltransferase [Bacteroides thetaiotaomicron]|uniref:DNA cytosine methyltransferase n=1 Tax=Bacteroides thetaiotaomicron TaxID=818 RepID=UPI0035AFDBA8
MGWKNAFHCEINPFCNEILKYWFPNSEHYEDITKTDFSQWKGRIDVLTGGFPCQPFSLAGQRKGADDNRYLWPHMLRAIREIRPAWVIGENVAGILTMVQPGKETEVGSQTSLFGEDNRKRILLRQEYVVETICKDLEREGYSVQPLLIPACAVGAPHRRDRVWLVAHCADSRTEDVRREREDKVLSDGIAPDTNGKRCNNRSDNWKERPFYYNRKRNSEEDQSKRDKRKCRTCKNGSVASDSQCSGSGQIQQKIQSKQSDGNSSDRNGSEWDVTYSDTSRLSTLRLPSNTETEDGKMRTDSLCNLPVMLGEHCLQNGGRTSQLNPLFVEEMMGFPLMWTTLPFLSQNGDRNQLKDMETP